MEKKVKTKIKSVRYVNGYRLIYRPDHSSAMNSANWDGYVYEHIVTAEADLGRRLYEDEVVHHLDENRQNNRKENLLVLTRAQHMKLHEWLRRSASEAKALDENRVNSKKPKFCVICNSTLQEKQLFCCSDECRIENAKSTRKPERDQLESDIATMSWLAMGRKYGVSDNAVRKWARSYDLLGNIEPKRKYTSARCRDYRRDIVPLITGPAPDTETDNAVGNDIVQGDE